MRKLVTLAALLVASSIPSAASAQFFAGARLGLGIPWGDAEKDAPMKDVIKAEIPIQVDVGLKLGQALAVGVYAGYALGMLSNDAKDACDAFNVSCSSRQLRFGAQVNLHAANTPATEFWGGVALGYAKLTNTIASGGVSFDASVTGYEATLQGGFDFLASSSVRAGPFASVSIGQFTKYDNDLGSGTIADKTMHGYFTIGVRGMFGG
jgi:hypothetical protein